MADGSVVIEIDAEDSGFREKLRSMGSAAEALAGGALKELNQWLEENQISAQDWSRMVSEATEEVINGFSLLDTSLHMDLRSMAGNLEENILSYNIWTSNLQTLMDAAVATGSQAAVDFMRYMQGMGIGAADQVQQMVDNIGWTMDTFPPLMEQAAEAGMTGARIQVENGRAGVETAAAGLMDGAVSAVQGADLAGAAAVSGAGIAPGLRRQEHAVAAAGRVMITGVISLWRAAAGQFAAAGTQAGQSLNRGLSSGKASLGATAEGMCAAVVSTVTGASGNFHNAGLSAAQSLAGGLASGQAGIAQAALSGAWGGYTAVAGLGWYTLGYNISAGIASGVRGGSGLITGAARAAAAAALSSAKASLGIHSPSRVFRDQVGRMIPSGIALGIESATPEAQAAITLSADKLLGAANAAVRPTVSEAARAYVTQNTIYHSGGGEALCLTVPLTLDGREFARATAKYTGRQMAYLEV